MQDIKIKDVTFFIHLYTKTPPQAIWVEFFFIKISILSHYKCSTLEMSRLFMKKINIILTLIIALPLIILTIIVLYVNLNSKNPKDIFLNNRSDRHFEGKIILIKNNQKNHNALTMYSKENSIVLPHQWDSKVKINDSIFKQNGELFLKIYRNGKLLDSLNYNDIKWR